MLRHSASDSAVGFGVYARKVDGSTPTTPTRLPATSACAASMTSTPRTPSTRRTRSTSAGGTVCAQYPLLVSPDPPTTPVTAGADHCDDYGLFRRRQSRHRSSRYSYDVDPQLAPNRDEIPARWRRVTC